MSSAYDRITRNLAATDDHGRGIMLAFARSGNALTGMAILCAAEGYTREDAARAIGCEPEALDMAIDALAASITAERKRRQAERAA